MSLDLVFHTDSEYHMHFTQKPIFIGSRHEISSHFCTFLPWLTYFHNLSIFFIFFLIFEAIFRISMKNYIDPYIPLFGWRLFLPPYRGLGGPNRRFYRFFEYLALKLINIRLQTTFFMCFELRKQFCTSLNVFQTF